VGIAMATGIIGRIAALLGRRVHEVSPRALGPAPPPEVPFPSPTPPLHPTLTDLERRLLAAIKSGGGALLLTLPSVGSPRMRIGGNKDHTFSGAQEFEATLGALQRLTRLGLLERAGAGQSGESLRLTPAGAMLEARPRGVTPDQP
jgi:hypothetical protein